MRAATAALRLRALAVGMLWCHGLTAKFHEPLRGRSAPLRYLPPYSPDLNPIEKNVLHPQVAAA